MPDHSGKHRPSGGLLCRAVFLKALDGDPAAEQQFYEDALAAVYTIAQALCRARRVSADMVDDVVQDTILSFLRQPAEKVAAIRDWQAWFYTVTRSRLMDHLRRTSRRRMASLDDPAGGDDDSRSALAAVLADDADTFSEVAANELAGLTEQFLSRQPKEKAEVFRLYLRGLLQREIADRTGKPINTVGVWIYRTKASLGQWLETVGWGRNSR